MDAGDHEEKILSIVSTEPQVKHWWRPSVVNGKLLVSSIFTVIVVAFAILGVALYYNVTEARKDRLTLCQAQNETRQVMTSVLQLAQARSNDPDSPFWTDVYKLIEPLNCSEISNTPTMPPEDR